MRCGASDHARACGREARGDARWKTTRSCGGQPFELTVVSLPWVDDDRRNGVVDLESVEEVIRHANQNTSVVGALRLVGSGNIRKPLTVSQT